MSPSRRATIFRRRGQLENAAARETLRLLRRFRRDILLALLEARGFRAWRLEQMLATVDAEILLYQPMATRATGQATRQAWRYGIEIVDASVPSVATSTLFGVSDSLLSAVVDVTTDASRRIWSELGSGLKLQIRRAALGVTDPFEAMTRVARLIRDPKTFGSVFTRAETIVRMEVNRTFSIATQDRMEQGDKRLRKTGERLMKYWLDADDSRVRPAHAAAGETYSKKNPIPVDEPFIVGGEALMFPRDPNGSAGNTIHCRCAHVPMVVSAEEFVRLKRAA